MITVTRKFEFDSAHRVLGHEGKCKHLHGHRYVAEVTAIAEGLDGLGRVIDFGVMKQHIGEWIELNWDHNTILNSNDPIIQLPLSEIQAIVGRGPYVLDNINPTAENIAMILFYISNSLMDRYCPTIRIIHVRVWETPNCCAVFTLKK